MPAPRKSKLRLATIGVYGFDRERFLRALDGAGVGALVDVRQRRGVRGSEYAWANSQRLQAALAEAGIEYRHMKELAPTTELRRLQYREDERRGEGKRSRTVLAPEYSAPLHGGDPRPRRPRAARGARRRAAASRRCSASSATPRPATAR